MVESQVDPVVKFLLIESRTVPVGRAGTREGAVVQKKAGSANPTVGQGGAQDLSKLKSKQMELTNNNIFETQRVYWSS